MTNFLCFSSRTAVTTARGRAPSPSITPGRSVSAVWAFPSCSMKTTWTSRPRAAPSPLEASPAWVTTDGLWTAGAGRPPSWVGRVTVRSYRNLIQADIFLTVALHRREIHAKGQHGHGSRRGQPERQTLAFPPLSAERHARPLQQPQR